MCLWADFISNIQRFVKCDSTEVHPLETAGILQNHDSLFSSLLKFLVSLDIYVSEEHFKYLSFLILSAQGFKLEDFSYEIYSDLIT